MSNVWEDTAVIYDITNSVEKEKSKGAPRHMKYKQCQQLSASEVFSKKEQAYLQRTVLSFVVS